MARDDYASTVSGIADVINALSELAKPSEDELLRLSADLESKRFEKNQTMQYNIRMLDKKIEQETVTRQRIMKTYPTLDPKFITSGGPETINILGKISEAENNDIRGQIKTLSDEIAALNLLEHELAGQAVYYETARGKFEAENLVLDPQEFDLLTKQYIEEHPDRPIAGLTKAYTAGKVDKAERFKYTKAVQGEYETKAEGNLISMQKMMSAQIAAGTEFEGIEGAEGDQVVQSQMLQALAFDNYSDFLSFLNREPTGTIKKAFYSFSPGIMRAMEEHSEKVASLRSEYLGVDEKSETDELLDKFRSDIKETKTTKEAFAIYKDKFDELPGRELKEKFFDAMELELGKGDLGKIYVNWLKIDPKASVGVSQSELILKPFEGVGGTVQETAQNVYDTLDKITSPESTSDIRNLTLNLSSRSAISALGVPGEKFPRPGYSAGKAIFSGLLGFDSPYYDAFYDSMDDSLKELVQEEDPWGPDWLVYGLPEEHMTPEIIKERYGLDLYNRAVEAADKLGRVAQIKAIEEKLKKKSGEDYYDLIRVLKSIELIK